jgi:dihydropteroate synthase
MYALKVSFANSFVFRQYDASYHIGTKPGLAYFTGYELFESDPISNQLPQELAGSSFFLAPEPGYPENVHGLLLMHDQNQFEEVAAQFGLYIENLAAIKDNHALHSGFPVMAGKPEIMGIINVTPDSFSDGGKNFAVDAALESAAGMIEAGLDILDIGGESTRPGSERVGEDEELKRVIPVISAIRKTYPAIKISVDTYKSQVAEEASIAGADIINDISGGTFDEKILDVTARYGKAYIAMHTPSDPKVMQVNPQYCNVVLEVMQFLLKQAEKAKKAGIKDVIIDPGIGFGKTPDQNYELLSRLCEFRQTGFPVLIGLSRKSFLGKSLNLSVEQRDNAGAMLDLFSLFNGASIIRTHNAEFGRQVKLLYQNLSGFHG